MSHTFKIVQLKEEHFLRKGQDVSMSLSQIPYILSTDLLPLLLPSEIWGVPRDGRILVQAPAAWLTLPRAL